MTEEISDIVPDRSMMTYLVMRLRISSLDPLFAPGRILYLIVKRAYS